LFNILNFYELSLGFAELSIEIQFFSFLQKLELPWALAEPSLSPARLSSKANQWRLTPFVNLELVWYK
jgi:hypothetical protein